MSGEPTQGVVPHNLPIGNFEGSGEEARIYHEEEVIRSLEMYAHEKYALVSSDALRFIVSQSGGEGMQFATLDRVIELVKARYPKEGDWIVINKEKVLAVLG